MNGRLITVALSPRTVLLAVAVIAPLGLRLRARSPDGHLPRTVRDTVTFEVRSTSVWKSVRRLGSAW
jgi:hypothetical protein